MIFPNYNNVIVLFTTVPYSNEHFISKQLYQPHHNPSYSVTVKSTH